MRSAYNVNATHTTHLYCKNNEIDGIRPNCEPSNHFALFVGAWHGSIIIFCHMRGSRTAGVFSLAFMTISTTTHKDLHAILEVSFWPKDSYWRQRVYSCLRWQTLLLSLIYYCAAEAITDTARNNPMLINFHSIRE